MALRLFLVISLSLSGCAHIKTLFGTDSKQTLTHGQTPLPSSIRPLQYVVNLEVDPRLARYNGRVDIDIEVSEASAKIDLHGDGLDIEDASIRVNGKTLVGKTHYGSTGALRISFDEEIPVGRAQLTLRYQAALNSKPGGLYRLQDGDDWYVFSHLAPSRARKAFPCFDQPNFKTPFTVSLKDTQADGRAWKRPHQETLR